MIWTKNYLENQRILEDAIFHREPRVYGEMFIKRQLVFVFFTGRNNVKRDALRDLNQTNVY